MKILVKIAVFLLPFAGIAQQKKVTKVQVLPLDTAVLTGKLANGFTYYIRKNTEPLHKAELYLVLKAGSILEDEDQLGLAHFMEHMNFKGTKHFPKNKLIDYLEKQGVRFGADLNAYTGFDETVYQLPISTTKPEVFNQGLQIMRDWAQDALLETDEIEAERGVIIEEKRLTKGVGDRMQQYTLPMLLNKSRYANRLPIGSEKVIMNCSPEAIRRFHSNWYRPDLQALIVVGDIDVKKTELQIKQLFSDLKNPAAAPKRIKYAIPLTGKNQFLTFTDPELGQVQLQVIMKMKAAEIKTKADYRSGLLNNLLNSMLAARYGEVQQHADVPYIQAAAGIGSLMANLSTFSISLVPHPSKIETGFKAAWRELDRARRFGFLTSELKRAKQNIMIGMETALKEKDKIASISYVKEYQAHFLNGTPAPAIETQYVLFKELLSGIKLSEIQQALNRLIKTTDRDIILSGPEKDKASLPTENKILSWIKEAESSPLPAYVDQVPTSSLMAVMPAPGKVIGARNLSDLGITELTLSNGMKVLLKPTDFKHDEILFSGFSMGGTSLYSGDDLLQASNAFGILGSMGLGKHSPTELGRLLDGKVLQVFPYLSDQAEGISGSTRSEDLETAMQLVYLYFTAPRTDKTLFDNIVSKSRPGLESRYSDPKRIFSDTVGRVMSGYSSRFSVPSAALLARLDLERMLTIYKERFANAGDFTFVFTGSFDLLKIRPLLERYLASLPSTGQAEQAIDHHVYPKKGRLEKTLNRGKEDLATVQLVYPGDFAYSRAETFAFSALRSVLQLRITERLRMLESGVYSPGVSAGYSKFPSRYSVSISFGCAPARVSGLIVAAEQEVERLRKEGVTVDELQKFTVAQQLSWENGMKQNGFWLNAVTGKLQSEEDLNDILTIPEALKSLTPEMVKALAQKYLDKDNLLVFKLMPEGL